MQSAGCLSCCGFSLRFGVFSNLGSIGCDIGDPKTLNRCNAVLGGLKLPCYNSGIMPRSATLMNKTYEDPHTRCSGFRLGDGARGAVLLVRAEA